MKNKYVNNKGPREAAPGMSEQQPRHTSATSMEVRYGGFRVTHAAAGVLALAMTATSSLAAVNHASSTGVAVTAKLSVATLPILDTAVGQATGTAPPAYDKTTGSIGVNTTGGLLGLIAINGTALSTAKSDVDGASGTRTTSATGGVTNLSIAIADLPLLAPLIEVGGTGTVVNSSASVTGNGVTSTVTASSTVTNLSLKISGLPVNLPVNPAPNTVIGADVLGLAGLTIYLNEQTPVTGTAGQQVTVTALRIKLDAVSGGSFGLLSGDIKVGTSSANQFADTDGDGIPDSADADSDGDGIPNSVEIANAAAAGGDTDGDGIPDYLDLDSDNDGINDVIEAGGVDLNGDGRQDGTDTDGNGLVDSVDPGKGGTALAVPDTDGDGVKDYLDLDSDNDGISDLVESGNAAADTDNDGTADGTDLDGDGIRSSVDGSPTYGDAGSAALPDTDGDGIPNTRDPSSNGPGSRDIVTAGYGARDANGDGKVDNATDADHDGIPDVIDHKPAVFGGLGNPSKDSDGDGIPDGNEGNGFTDTDGDGVPDSVDADSDGDGIPDAVEKANAPANGDTDGDGIVDWKDLDSDNDGINDVIEAGGVDANGDGRQDGSADVNGNGLVDTADPAVPGGVALPVPDTDGDGVKNYLDLDSDNDTVSDLVESGNAAADINDDGVADGTDTDGDGIKSSVDGSPTWGDTGSPALPDTDGDGIPNVRDPSSNGPGTRDIETAGNGGLDTNGDGKVDNATDTDHDGIPDVIDKTDTGFGGLGDTTKDSDGDGIPDNEEGNGLVDTDGDGVPDSLDLDSDGDGIPDAVEFANAPANGDSDGDGVVDWLDLDSDNDGINDVFEAGGVDANGDGRQDGVDANHNGIVDSVEPAQGGTALLVPDSDGDGAKDYIDLDSDNDTISDLVEGGSGAVDSDHDGMVDGTDTDKDGIIDAVDGLVGFGDAGATPPTNTDGTDVPDYIDTDSDNAGGPDILTSGNGNLDQNGDGRVDGPFSDPDHDGVDAKVDTVPGAFGGTGGCVKSGGAWKQTTFTAAEQANPAISGWTADPDQDGISNALEFAFGTDPKTPNAPSPLVPEFTSGSSGGIKVTVDRNECSRAFINVEYSTDLVTWTGTGPGITYNEETPERLVATVTGPSGGTQQRLFVRIRVTVP